MGATPADDGGARRARPARFPLDDKRVYDAYVAGRQSAAMCVAVRAGPGPDLSPELCVQAYQEGDDGAARGVARGGNVVPGAVPAVGPRAPVGGSPSVTRQRLCARGQRGPRRGVLPGRGPA